MQCKKVTVVIPTLQKNKIILSNLIRSLDSDEFVDEIILIDNSLQGFKGNSKKLKVIMPDKNLYVNPSWNLGVKLAKNEIIALLNDDIIIPQGFCGEVGAQITLQTGIAGMCEKCIKELPEVFEIPLKEEIKLEPASYMDYYYGIAMFFHKENYYKIPDEIKIVYGDCWIFMQAKRNKKQNRRICGCTVYHYGSLTSGRVEFNPIAKNDAKIYKRLTVKWYHRLFSYEELWDYHKFRIFGITVRFKKKNALKVRHG